jgi:hypothetical protein
MLVRSPLACRLAASALVLTIAATAKSSSAQTDSTWRDHERALQAARQANDTTVYRAQLNAIYSGVGATQRIATRYAALALGAHDSAGRITLDGRARRDGRTGWTRDSCASTARSWARAPLTRCVRRMRSRCATLELLHSWLASRMQT